MPENNRDSSSLLTRAEMAVGGTESHFGLLAGLTWHFWAEIDL